MISKKTSFYLAVLLHFPYIHYLIRRNSENKTTFDLLLFEKKIQSSPKLFKSEFVKPNYV